MTSTDISIGWAERLAIANKTQVAVSEVVQQFLSFDLLGLASDNSSEFTLAPDARADVNETLFRNCQAEEITFTHSRPYRKNDQAHVE